MSGSPASPHRGHTLQSRRPPPVPSCSTRATARQPPASPSARRRGQSSALEVLVGEAVFPLAQLLLLPLDLRNLVAQVAEIGRALLLVRAVVLALRQHVQHEDVREE